MIPRAHLTAWRSRAPWADDAQVEQDLALSRALAELFSDPIVAGSFALRGGTALNKVLLAHPARYSEDVDLVQVRAEPIGLAARALRARLDPWLGAPSLKRGADMNTFVYRFESELPPTRTLRVKIEINTREHASLFGHEKKSFVVTNPWFSGKADVVTYSLDELTGTKLRALYQRKKGRDLFDLWLTLKTLGVDPKRVVAAFSHYLARAGTTIGRIEFEKNLREKATDPAFTNDVAPLLVPGSRYDHREALAIVLDSLVALL